MSLSMDESEIDIEPIGDGVRIHLPNRKLGGAKKVGWAILVMALLITLFMISWIAMPVGWGIGIMMKGEMLGALFIAFGCLGLGGLYAAAKFIALGVAVLKDRTRCSVSIEENRLLCREHFGWFSYKRKIPRDSIDQLYIAPVGAMGSSRSETSENRSGVVMIDSVLGGDVSNLYSIITNKRNGKRIVPGYPKEILDLAASAIAKELNRSRTDSVLINRDEFSDDDARAESLVTVQNLTEEEVQQSDFIRPDDSQIDIIEEGDSLVYRVPERTLMKGSGGLFFFSLFWNGFMVIFTMSLFFGNGFDFLSIPFILIFWTVGIGILVGAMYMAWQSALIGVKDGLLFIERKTIFGTKWTEFNAEEIDSVEMAYANVEVNNVRVMNLKIQPLEQKPVSMFAHLDNSELQWLAQQLRRSLGVESKQLHLAVGNFDQAGELVVPASTDIKVQQDRSRTTIIVPPRDFDGAKTLWLLGMTFSLAPVPAALSAMWFVGFRLEPFMFAIAVSITGAVMYVVHRFITTRNYYINVTAQQLDVEVRGFMSNHGLSAKQPEVKSVNVLDSELQLSGRSLYCVQIKVNDGKGLMMMTGRKEEELVYVARLIHQQLRLDHSVSSN